MFTRLLEIQPPELEFTFELKKQSSCSICLYNQSHHNVAFKVKTTSPKKYCVRPNVGIIRPQSSLSFTVTMQAQRDPPLDLICKDKFLIQSTVVHAGTSESDITAAMFSKDEGRYIEEAKLKVMLLSPSSSPSLSPIHRRHRRIPHSDATIIKDQVHNKRELSPDFLSHEVVWKSGEVNFEEFKHVRDAEGQKPIDNTEVLKSELDAAESKPVSTPRRVWKSGGVEFEDLKPLRDASPRRMWKSGEVEFEEIKPLRAATPRGVWKSGEVEFEVLKPVRDARQQLVYNVEVPKSKLHAVEPNPHLSSMEDQKIVADIEMLKSKLHAVESKLVTIPSDVWNFKEVKPEEPKPTRVLEDLKLFEGVHTLNLKLNALDSKLLEAQTAIFKLSSERKQDMDRTDLLRQEIATLRRERVVKKVQIGFPFLFVCMVALINLVLGYLLHR